MNISSATTSASDEHGEFRRAVSEHPFEILIGGSATAGQGQRMTAVDPATEEELTTFPTATPADLEHAVEVATRAGKAWAASAWEDRAAALESLASAIEANAVELARLESIDAGLTTRTATKDVADAARSIRYFAGLGGEIAGRVFPWTPGNPLVQLTREPYGVVGKIVPFNHPLKFASAKSAPPLMAGNSVIVKPSEFTSLSSLRLAELAADVLPEGVLTVLPGRGDVGAALAAHPQIPRLTFTGSAQTGENVLHSAAPEVKHVTMELGGKNPMIVFPDADPIEAGRAAVQSLDLFRTPGQACWSLSRVLVHDEIREPFLSVVEEEMARIRIGDPLENDVDLGPLAYAGHYKRVCQMVLSGIEQGASLVVGGKRPPDLPVGYFLQPTLFADVAPTMRIANEEIFGPVMSVLSWRDVDDVLRLANESQYGLTASIWSADVPRAQALARWIEAGIVWINSPSKRPTGVPFGGYKRSGIGREGNLEEMTSYMIEKAVVTGTEEANFSVIMDS